MIHFFSNHKIIFKLTNLILLIIYLYPGSLAGFVVYNDFTKQPLVINGCSDLMKEVFGDRGVHARAAVGVNSLPLGFSVEIEAIFKIN